MSRLANKQLHSGLRKHRVRKLINGTDLRPRLSVHVSNKHISAQIISDQSHATLVSATTVGSKAVNKSTMTDKAIVVGSEIAKKAKSAKLSRVVFDRGGKLYHGRVKALADSARDNGLEF